MTNPVSTMSLVVAACILVAGCSSPSDPPGIDISHVHGIAYEGGKLYLATHHGLAVGTPSGKAWTWEFAGSERFDLMGFTSASGTFYASGHPDDPRAYGGTMLGLRKSVDQGVTWEQLSYKGRADFHALTAVPGTSGHLLAWWQGSILNSTDGGHTWTNQTSPAGGVYALHATPTAVWAGTMSGLHRSDDGGKTWVATSLVAAVGTVAAAADGSVMYASELARFDGRTWVSRDAGATWTQLDGHQILSGTGAPIAFVVDAADARHAFASDGSGTVIESTDAGASWKALRNA